MSAQLSRKSNIELLRIVSQYYIILYHVFCFFIYPNTGVAFFKAIQMTFHVGVIDFVLSSGVFGIRPTSKGLLKLLSIFAVYSLPYIIYECSNAGSLRTGLSHCLFFSQSPLWFVKTYVYLYLLSPVLNLFIQHSTTRQKWYAIWALVFISVYMGMVKGDDSLLAGKNLPTFMLYYLIGNILYQYKDKLTKISLRNWIVVYVLLNLIILVSYCAFSKGAIGKIIWHVSFIYCSPILIINAVALFIIFARMEIKSRFVNWVAKSSFAIYLIHGNRPYAYAVLGTASVFCVNSISNHILLFFAILILGIVVIAATVAIDKLLTPLWNLVEKLGAILYAKLKF